MVKIRRMALAGFTSLIVLQLFVDFDLGADFEEKSGPTTELVKKRRISGLEMVTTITAQWKRILNCHLGHYWPGPHDYRDKRSGLKK